MRARKEGRIGKVPYEPRLLVDTWWDLGMDDYMSIWFTQTYGNEIRVIDFYENSGEGLPHYVNVLAGKSDEHRHRREYVYGVHHAPHDIEVREFSSGKARIDTARELGLKFRTCKVHEVADGIECVRNLLPSVWMDPVKCESGLEALRQFRKEWNEEKKIFSDHPCHDWTSHAADAFRIYAWGRRTKSKWKEKPQDKAVDDYDYLAV